MAFNKVVRLIPILLIIAAFGMAIARVPARERQVKGASISSCHSELGSESKLKIPKPLRVDKIRQVRDDRNCGALNDEIEKTLKVVQERPDYAGAWLRLSVLYNQVGDIEKSKSALETAIKLNPDME